MKKWIFLLLLTGLTIYFSACRKESFITGKDAILRVTADTITQNHQRKQPETQAGSS
jgi:hypothetical protein